ncbi:unnamed protein product, partial [marine sediment metagenome]
KQEHWEFDWSNPLNLDLWFYDGYCLEIAFEIPKYGTSDKPYEIEVKGILDAEALGRCDDDLKKNPGDKKAWVDKGCSFSASYDWAMAVACFDKALEIDPKYKEAWLQKGKALPRGPGCDQLKRIACFDEALSIDPDYKEAWLGKADALYLLNFPRKIRDAIECIDRALEIDPQNDDALDKREFFVHKAEEFSDEQ